jgi:CheY-like chemotaxis protein
MKKRILVAEDDPGIRRLLEVILSSMGAEKVEFTICENGAVALEAAIAVSA